MKYFKDGSLDISIHAPHARSDEVDNGVWRFGKYFNPRSSCEERLQRAFTFSGSQYFNPRSSCEERLERKRAAEEKQEISIHAPHARSDSRAAGSPSASGNFNPRSSCEERPGLQQCALQSSCHFNPRSSCEERLVPVAFVAFFCDFNPRSSCEERPAFDRRALLQFLYFNPRSSCEERLQENALFSMKQQNFNPRSSCEERRKTAEVVGNYCKFQSTLLMRGATCIKPRMAGIYLQFQSTLLMRGATHTPARKVAEKGISIHAPHARSDTTSWSISCASRYFNPRSSCEERLRGITLRSIAQNFNPRSSCEERHGLKDPSTVIRISIHAPHARSDRSQLLSR